MKSIKTALSAAAVFLLMYVGASLLLKPSVYAQDIESSQCYQSTQPFYDARDVAKPGAYDIYVKLGRAGQEAPVSLYIEDQPEQCVTIGSTEANGETWQKIGSWTSTLNDPVNFKLSSANFTTQVDANRPSIMLVPQTDPPCTPGANCDFSLDGAPAFIIPTSTLLSENDLRVLQVINPSTDTLKRVDYYSGGQLLYSTPTLQPFNMRYVRGGDHILSRVLQYKSGQKVVLQSEVSVSFVNDFQNLLFRLFHSNKVGLQIFAVIIILALLASVAIAVIHFLHRRYVWKLSHGVIKEPPPIPAGTRLPDNYVAPPHYLSPESKLITITKRATPFILLLAGIIVIVGIVDAYVGQLFQVDGPSMEQTLQTDDQIYVNRLPKTWATLNGGEFVPKRGQVVVFHKTHSSLFLEENSDEGNVYVVKRVIGLPGERVLIKDGVVTVYNQEHPAGFNPDANSPWQSTMIIDPAENIDVTLGPSEIFVSGDNRPESLDSRTNGPININDLVGVVEARILPLGKQRLL